MSRGLTAVEPNAGYAGQFSLRFIGWRKSLAAWLSSLGRL